MFLISIGAGPVEAATGPRAALGTSAAVDRHGRLWIAYAEPRDGGAVVLLQRSSNGGASWQAPLRVIANPEPVSAAGEDRPRLAFGPGEEIYVAWTMPTSAGHTGDIRFARSLDGGKSWSAPSVVHRDRQLITHDFGSLLVDTAGRVWIAWLDRRDRQQAQAAGHGYAGAAIYYAYSEDRGEHWRGDFKLADGSCECCRIAATIDARGQPAVLWRHVFASSERDHAFATLKAGQAAPALARATFDRWRLDGCPHHGPALAIDAKGTRHAVWFNQVAGQGRVFYGQLTAGRPTAVKALPPGAEHADVAVAGTRVAVAWKRYDGTATRVETWLSSDGGASFTAGPALETSGASDQPRLVSTPSRLLLVWRRAEDVAVRELTSAPPAQARVVIAPFGRGTLTQIEQRYAGKPFWLVLWDLECAYCVQSLRNFAAAERAAPGLRLVTVATDRIEAARELEERLAQLAVRSDAYAFAEEPPEALRFAIDPAWLGEKPRAYRYRPDGARETISGVVDVQRLRRE